MHANGMSPYGQQYGQHYEEHDVDPIKATILRQLWEASREPNLWSLAKLSKRTNVPMSTLLRTLAEFEAAGIVDIATEDDGRSFASLNATGIEVFPSLFNTQ